MKQNRGIFFLLAWLGMVLYFTQRWIYGPTISSLMEAFDIGASEIGLIGSASIWGYMFTPILAGWISDRFGRKKAVLFGIFGFSMLTIVCGLAGSWGQLFAGRFLTGAVEAYFFIPLLACTLEFFPERPGFYLTLMSSGSSLGWFTGPALAGWLVERTGNWRAPFLTTGLIALFVAILLLLCWPEEKKAVPPRALFDKSILTRSNLGLLGLLSLVFAFQISAEFGFTMWYPAFLELEKGVTIAAAGMIAGCFGLGQFLGRPVLGWLSDRFSYRLTGIGSGVVNGISLILILMVSTEYLQGWFTFQAGFVGAGVMGALWTFTGLVFSDYKGLALGIITTVGYALGSAAPMVIGHLGEHYSIGTGLWAVCIPASFLAAAAFSGTFYFKPFSRRMR